MIIVLKSTTHKKLSEDDMQLLVPIPLLDERNRGQDYDEYIQKNLSDLLHDDKSDYLIKGLLALSTFATIKNNKDHVKLAKFMHGTDNYSLMIHSQHDASLPKILVTENQQRTRVIPNTHDARER